MRNYLLRLGWGHGDDEIIPTRAGDRMFDLETSAARLRAWTIAKLTNLNGIYLRERPMTSGCRR